MSEWIETDRQPPPVGVMVLVSKGVDVTTQIAEESNNGIGWKWSMAEGWKDPRSVYRHWMPLPPPPTPKLTVREALNEAIREIENLDAVFDLHAFKMISPRPAEENPLLPRLRAALEEE